MNFVAVSGVGMTVLLAQNITLNADAAPNYKHIGVLFLICERLYVFLIKNTVLERN